MRLLEDDIDHARHGIRPVNGGGAIFEHLDALHGVDGNGRDVDEVSLTVIGQGIRGHAIAVNEYQRRPHREASKRNPAAACAEGTWRGLPQRAHVVGRDVGQHVCHACVARPSNIFGTQ